MIGEDDLEDLFDPDEFGVEVMLLEAGQAARVLRGTLGGPRPSGGLYRSGSDPNAAQLRVKPVQEILTVAASAVPAGWKSAKVVLRGVEHSIARVEPAGRIRTALVLVPYGDKASQPPERGKWQASS
ncbi:hypothetical protein [Pseudomonas aeruginosa]|uniref:hypothetical protein n=1 Tax=Pseudomonas aeruginosa TaxID=287 RepID=UPI000691E14E|nr:hypothetical protein [Pseudomonas aeruginosa]